MSTLVTAVNGLILINELLLNAETARQNTMRVITQARAQNREPTAEEIKGILETSKELMAQWNSLMPDNTNG